ncbi:MAG: cyclic nucleotide-binding domain-containing protein [Pseudooceanicola sp.]|nr:cyclic nucleotide-binding domain-containing protein [Pseudooceanicola sp.]
MLLAVTATLFPLLYLTLELPKRIINDAIGATSATIDVFGWQVGQVIFLGLLCAAFLLSVLAHGLVKMRINTMKGILAERMLRRFRYLLIARILRFPQPYFERVSQGELVSMITAESEPMGGLMGDMISQPVLQAGQMITILGFLFFQSFWFGVAACALIPLQAWLIPRLQRQINLLNKKRIQQVRVLAANIGESAQGVSAIRANAGWRYRLAEITSLLGKNYEIRFEIYQKKFFMKFINNFIGQLTPFFFFAIGGYLVIQGAVSIGALVAALAAYKDLSSPWKELLDYYNQAQDMSLRWEVVTERFAPDGLLDDKHFDGEPEVGPLTGDITLDHVTVRDADGNAVLEDLNAVLPGGGTIGIAAPSGEDRRALGELLTREVMPAAGTVRFGETDIRTLHHSAIAGRVGLASSRPLLFRGSFGDNVLMPIRRRPVGDSADPARHAESLRAGNSADPFDADWVDPSAGGFADAAELRAWWLRLIDAMGPNNALFRRGLDQVFDETAHPDLARRLVQQRVAVRIAIEDAGLGRYVHFFDVRHYNPALPVIENLLFATARVPITTEVLAAQSAFLAQLRKLGMQETLVTLNREVIDMLRQIFGMDGTEHPLFRNLGLDPGSFEAAAALVEKTRNAATGTLSDEDFATLLTVPSRVSAEQIGPAFPDSIKTQVLELRRSHSGMLVSTFGDLFAPLDPRRFAPGLTVLENALFGIVSKDAGSKTDDIQRAVAPVLIESGAQEGVVQLIYDLPVPLGGANLPAQVAEPLALSRAAIKRPDVLILDQALASYPAETRASVGKALRELLPKATIIHLAETLEDDRDFDVVFELRQGRIQGEDMIEASDEDTAASADLGRKMRALEQTEMFGALSRKQLRLLAFGARWYDAKKGDTVFLKNDPPTDGAFLVLEGNAGLYLPRDGQEDQLIATAGPGKLVGELGLIRNEPRALSMKADTDLRCLRIGAAEFLAVVENDAAMAFRLLQVVAKYVSN